MGEVNAVFREEKFQWEGVDYKVQRPNLETEKVFETWLEDKALAKIKGRRDRGKIRDDEYRIELSVFQRDCAAGEYSKTSDTAIKATSKILGDGMAAWIAMILRQSNPGMRPPPSEEFVTKVLEAQCKELAAKNLLDEMPELVQVVQMVNSETPTMPPNPSGAND